MAIHRITPAIAVLIYFLLLALPSTTPIVAVSSLNVTAVLSAYPELSAFTALVSGTTIPSDLASRTSLTILAVPNSYLSASVDVTRHLSPTSLADLLRYHIVLQYISPSDLFKIPPSGSLLTTLFQTTGRATSNFGSVNITRNPSTDLISVRSPAPFTPSNATVLALIKTVPYNLSIFSVNSLLVPYGSDLTASETRPTLDLNITKALIDGHNFNVAASMLAASGVVEEFEADEGGAGITLFVPTDMAFAELPSSDSLQSLPAVKKSVVLKYHVLHSYYPLGSLESMVNPLQPTLATEDMGAGSFTLNISRVNGSLAIDTGIVLASVTQTVFDENPVAIFGISKVLLPREFFGKNPSDNTSSGRAVMSTAAPPDALSPDSYPEDGGPPSRLTSPPGSSTGAADNIVQRLILGWSCIVVYLLV
ncbi:fasciclin-like arabinogalactan protein 4 [Punica granatum]|uniref:Fasciclin-like arabinogalactan protein 4 n=1 Tax=Punica granatum TaxID=22663 RepID=A0A6P8CPV5_PUNGR|nr:fasciclin-like arabinogalactan protein 4 [Punica granatum]